MAWIAQVPFSLVDHTDVDAALDLQRWPNDQSSQHAYQVSFDGNDLAYLWSYLPKISMDAYYYR